MSTVVTDRAAFCRVARPDVRVPIEVRASVDDRRLSRLETGVYDRVAAWTANNGEKTDLRITACPRVGANERREAAYDRGLERALALAHAIDTAEPDPVVVRRNDEIDVREIRALDPDGIIVSPGPGTPASAGVSVPIFSELSYPTLGVCLGHQALCVAAGESVGHAPAVVHGKPSTITHDGRGVFADPPERIEVGRYHSLAVTDELPDCLTETAHTDDRRAVMGVRHREKPNAGVQFHPESILTDAGNRMIETFCRRCLDSKRCTTT